MRTMHTNPAYCEQSSLRPLLGAASKAKWGKRPRKIGTVVTYRGHQATIIRRYPACEAATSTYWYLVAFDGERRWARDEELGK